MANNGKAQFVIVNGNVERNQYATFEGPFNGFVHCSVHCDGHPLLSDHVPEAEATQRIEELRAMGWRVNRKRWPAREIKFGSAAFTQLVQAFKAPTK